MLSMPTRTSQLIDHAVADRPAVNHATHARYIMQTSHMYGILYLALSDTLYTSLNLELCAWILYTCMYLVALLICVQLVRN